MRILLVVSAPAYMSPSTRDSNYLNTLKKSGLNIPSFDIENESVYLDVARPFARRARDLFQGCFKKVMEGVRIARDQGIKIDVFLLTPRYGLIKEDEFILPHSVDMGFMKKKDLQILREKLKISEKLSTILKESYDLFILILKKDHVPLIFADEKSLNNLAGAAPKVVLVSAPSLAGKFGEPIKFVGIKQIGKRAEAFVKLVDSLTTKTLNDYLK
ncbi:MAG: hypothetical protein ACP5KV_06775 [Candidatus Methanomethylicaceae archaeon]